MKFRKFAFCLVALIVVFAVSVTSVPDYFLNNTVSVSAATYLKKNSSGTQVKNLQNDLILLGYMKSGTATGKFDTVTETAVKKVQSNYGLTSDGIAGPDTLNLVEDLIDGTAKVVQITGTTVNVRSGAGTSYGKVTTVKNGQKYTYSSYKKVSNVNWYKIKVGNKSGYVSGSYVKVVKITPASTGSSASTTATKATTVSSETKTTTTTKVTATTTKNNSDSGTAASGKLTITGNNVNVRMGAGTSYLAIAKVDKGETYEYTNVKTVNGSKWYYIKVNVFVKGWVSGSYVSIQSTNTTATVQTTTSSSAASSSTTTTTAQKTTTTAANGGGSNVRTVTVGTVTASKLNVRASASTSGKVLGTLGSGSDVVIVSKGSKWHKIEFGSGYGYVSADYISNIRTVTQAVSLSYSTDYYYVDKGDTVNVSLSVSGAAITYSSSDSKSCPVSAKGIVTGKTEGLYTITAKSGSVSASTYVVVIREPYTGIKAMKISRKGADFIAECEGGGTVIASGEMVFYPYQDSSGFWTVGYGHALTSAASKSWSEERAIAEFNKDIERMIGAQYKMTDDKPYLTKDTAVLLLNADLNDGDDGTYVKTVSDWAVRNGIKLTQSQFDALVSFCYNLGESYWANDNKKFYLKSAIISHRSGSDADPDQIIHGFCLYIKSGSKNLKGLWYRRRNEAEMFIKGDYTLDRSNKFTPPSDVVWS